MTTDHPTLSKPRRRWFQFSLGSLMIVVTIVAMGAGIWKWGEGRRKEFLMRALVHSIRTRPIRPIRLINLRPVSPEEREWREYNKNLAEKYYRAARYPWLPDWPDPPPPE